MPDRSAELPTSSAMRRALRRARDGVALDVTEATVLLHAAGDDLVDLCASAARVRDARLANAGRPGVITFSKTSGTAQRPDAPDLWSPRPAENAGGASAG